MQRSVARRTVEASRDDRCYQSEDSRDELEVMFDHGCWYIVRMRSLVRAMRALLIFAFAAACGGSTSNPSTDAGTSNDAASSGDAQSTAQEDAGAAVDSGGVVKTGADTAGINLSPDIEEWSIESNVVFFTFTMIVDPSLKLASVDGANIRFDGDTPHAFGFGQDTDLGTASTAYSWEGGAVNNPGARVSLSLATASKGAVTGEDARPYSPYESGNLHVLLYGTLSSGDEWQASTSFTAQ